LAPVSASCMAGCSGSTSTSAASSLRSVLRRLSPLRYIRRWLQSCSRLRSFSREGSIPLRGPFSSQQ
jgi:hypothetical protein